MLTMMRAGRRVCRGCGYDLAGLPARGMCPECGAWFASFVTRLPGVGRRERARSLRGWAGLAVVWKAVAVSVLVVGSAVVTGWIAKSAWDRLVHALEWGVSSGES